jgi:hypothetical protein
VHRLIAKMGTMAACAYKHSIGQPIIYPKNELSYAANFLHMMFATPCEAYHVDPVIEKALDLLLILHADHEQNCSTSTVRLVGSSMVNLFAAVSAGINALWGRSHGGANQEVIEMLAEIRDEGISARQFVERAKSRDNTARLMGFGHRVYRNFDPRMKIIKKACTEVLEKLGVHTKLLEIAMELEEIALKDDYFVERKLYPNVDFYSGVIYNAIGTPANMFTAIFALGRLPAGSRSGSSCTAIRTSRSAARARSTPGDIDRLRPARQALIAMGVCSAHLGGWDAAPGRRRGRARRRLGVRRGARAATRACGSARVRRPSRLATSSASCATRARSRCRGARSKPAWRARSASSRAPRSAAAKAWCGSSSRVMATARCTWWVSRASSATIRARCAR